MKPLSVVLVALTLVSCSEDDSRGNDPPTDRVGTRQQCEQRLDDALSKSYLREQGIASLSALDKELQIIETCRSVPSSFPIDEAAYLATSEIVERLR